MTNAIGEDDGDFLDLIRTNITTIRWREGHMNQTYWCTVVGPWGNFSCGEREPGDSGGKKEDRQELNQRPSGFHRLLLHLYLLGPGGSYYSGGGRGVGGSGGKKEDEQELNQHPSGFHCHLLYLYLLGPGVASYSGGGRRAWDSGGKNEDGLLWVGGQRGI